MTGPEHYREAEYILERLAAKADSGRLSEKHVAVNVALAQVHATLALAAASALSIGAEARRSVHLGWATVVDEVPS